MNRHIQREAIVHGEAWNSIHDGYFSDGAVAAPLVGKVRELAAESRARRIVDLGGGNGFLLRQIRAAGLDPEVCLVNLDASGAQLAAASGSGISCINGSLDAFERRDLGAEDVSTLFAMRSVLHYFGREGLHPAIRHIRKQVRAGEFWVHQTAAFKESRDADCLNGLYGMMRTSKWYFTVKQMTASLEAAGWCVRDVVGGAPLALSSESLALRYGIERDEMCLIRGRMMADFSVPEEVLKITDGGFCAYLHYWIYVCTPIGPGR
ncbi:MAG: class I SAM-dependent methyltransferase [bacterium]